MILLRLYQALSLFFLFLLILHFFFPFTLIPAFISLSFTLSSSFNILLASFFRYIFFLSFHFSLPHSWHKFMFIHTHKISCLENQHSNYVFSLDSNTNNRQIFNDLTSVNRWENQNEVLQKIAWFEHGICVQALRTFWHQTIRSDFV